MSVLGLLQMGPQLRGELSRRIGYTNGLFDIFRFARVVSYLHTISPATNTSLRGKILEHESIKGAKYVDGVIDVARALGLVHKTGTTLSLSDTGYALHAVQQLEHSQLAQDATRALLLHSVLKFDGDATLNLLDILANKVPSSSIGELLIDRLLLILDLRIELVHQQIESKSAKDILLQELSDSKYRLAAAVDLRRRTNQSWSAFSEERKLTPEQRIQRFYSHTVNPRRGWLKDLGCIQEKEKHQYTVTNSGHQLLASFRNASCYTNSIFLLPFSVEVSELLGVPNPEVTRDLLWRSTASSFGELSKQTELSSEEFLQFIIQIYPHVKFHLFNEVAIDSIYSTLAAQFASEARYLPRDFFTDALEALIKDYPDTIYRLRQRYGGTGYVAIKKTV